MLTGVLFGPRCRSPAAPCTRPRRKEAGDPAGGREREARWWLSKMALSLVLLAGAGLMIQSFLKAWNSAPGFNPENLLTFSLGLPQTGYSDETKRAAFGGPGADRTREIVGVVGAVRDRRQRKACS
jgi:putative ABC transport system permease protein